jgi:very-short-patch-repair endonuclease
MRASERTFVRAKSLRRTMSPPEVMLWQYLRGSQLGGLRFRRQHPIGPYILDFYCAELQLAVEVDGQSHDFRSRALADQRRDAWLQSQGVRVARFLASDVLSADGIEAVLKAILNEASAIRVNRIPDAGM